MNTTNMILSHADLDSTPARSLEEQLEIKPLTLDELALIGGGDMQVIIG